MRKCSTGLLHQFVNIGSNIFNTTRINLIAKKKNVLFSQKKKRKLLRILYTGSKQHFSLKQPFNTLSKKNNNLLKLHRMFKYYKLYFVLRKDSTYSENPF